MTDTLFDLTPPARGPQTTVSELAKRDAVLDAHETNYRDVLRMLRLDMEILYRQRVHTQGHAAYVTADDARAMLAMSAAYRGMKFASMNWLGALFNPRDWEQTGQWIKSTTPGSHGNTLFCWRLKGGA